MKKCNICQLNLPLDSFYKDRSTKDGKTRKCRDCSKQYAAIYRRENYDEIKRKDRERNRHNPNKYMQKMYGISPTQFIQMVKSQGGRCLICDRESLRLHIDHNHKTKEVRGLLCPTCNRGLGMFYDNPELLEEAAHYLRRKVWHRNIDGR